MTKTPIPIPPDTDNDVLALDAITDAIATLCSARRCLYRNDTGYAPQVRALLRAANVLVSTANAYTHNIDGNAQ